MRGTHRSLWVEKNLTVEWSVVLTVGRLCPIVPQDNIVVNNNHNWPEFYPGNARAWPGLEPPIIMSQVSMWHSLALFRTATPSSPRMCTTFNLWTAPLPTVPTLLLSQTTAIYTLKGTCLLTTLVVLFNGWHSSQGVELLWFLLMLLCTNKTTS